MTDTGPRDLNATEARQGSRSNRIIWVLLGGLLLVVIGFAIVAMSHGDELGGGRGGGQELASGQAAAEFNAPEPAPKQNDQVKAPGVPGSQSPSLGAPQPNDQNSQPTNTQ